MRYILVQYRVRIVNENVGIVNVSPLQPSRVAHGVFMYICIVQIPSWTIRHDFLHACMFVCLQTASHVLFVPCTAPTT